MDFLFGLLDGSVSLADLIRWGGYVILVAIVFCETGLLIGFFLPGDSLLITAGLVAATGALDIWWINGLLIAAAIIGDSVGYAIGYRAGPRLFTKEESLLFSRKHSCARRSSTRSTAARRSCSPASSRSSAPSRRWSRASGRWSTAASSSTTCSAASGGWSA